MSKLVVALAVGLLLAPTLAFGQVDLRIRIPLPPTPPLVVVTPGIQVVEDLDDEVFFTGGFYWARRDGHWFRARSPRVEFVRVEPTLVPVALVKSPPGRYKRFKKPRGHERSNHAEHRQEKGNKHGKHR